ncbi:MAG: hypothetical protein GF331_02090 [Chitinivibrionales bacterium]|nr:hypothetical protein [Chitinivibrionales bacterium]
MDSTIVESLQLSPVILVKAACAVSSNQMVDSPRATLARHAALSRPEETGK